MATPDSSPAQRWAPTLQKFLETEASGGVVLVLALAAALLWANLDAAGYTSFWQAKVLWIDEGLMTLFFFVAGLEIKRELKEGELAHWSNAALPVFSAAGGMAVPALIYLLINHSGEAVSGWAVPMATDIALALGVLALLGPRVPAALKVFLLTLAIADDVGAIAIIAIVYAHGVDMLWLGAATAVLGGILGTRRLGVNHRPVHILLGAALWFALLRSGVHATMAGAAAGLLWPVDRLTEERLHPWTSFLIVPLFALASAGIRIDRAALVDAVGSPVTLGVAAGLIAGKTLGILGFAWLATRLRAISLPVGTGWTHLAGVAALAGIGFTVALFITPLAFDRPDLQQEARAGILAGSILSALLGAAILSRTKPREAAER